jgi:hypothetical protein
MLDKKILIRATITGFVWWFTYLYIRRLLNPENKGDIQKYKLDGLYGGIASFVGVFITSFLSNRLL